MNRKLSIVASAILTTTVAQSATAGPPSQVLRHLGMCDASAAVPVGDNLFAVANDEDNTLRVYKRDEPGAAVYSQDLSAFLQIEAKHPEADIEGATLVGNRIYWITSHGANKEGKPRPNRHRLFATDIETNGNTFNLKPVGTPFIGLVQALEDSDNAAGLKDYLLSEAAKQAPESKGGLNIEGLTRTPDGKKLLIGFRNPIPNGKALLVSLENPQAVVVEKEKPKLGRPIPMDLRGAGIRSIEYSDANKTYFIIAGPYDDNGDFHLYQWSGNPSEEPTPMEVDFQGLHPEAVVVYPKDTKRIQILSDDGSEQISGKDCKDLEKPQDKSFRSIWINL